nr:RNA polymerase sigma factor [Xanthomonas oryzae]
MPGWRRTGGYGKTASEGSIPACSSSTWRSWHCCSGEREQVLRRFARAIAGHPADADDLPQVAIERALRHCAQWRPETPLQYWLFGIIRHAWLDEVRAQRRRRQLFVSAAEGEGEQVGDSPMERKQEWMAVQAARRSCPTSNGGRSPWY